MFHFPHPKAMRVTFWVCKSVVMGKVTNWLLAKPAGTQLFRGAPSAGLSPEAGFLVP